jgi:TnpA family transposase
MQRGTNTKAALLNAFDSSEKKKIAGVCRLAGTTPSTFYFHFYKDSDFRREVLKKRVEYLTATINDRGEQ